MKLRFSIAALLLTFGCGQSVAPKNPLAANLLQTPEVLCNSRYNFETPGSDSVWTAPSWATGNAGPCVRVSGDAACGNWSLETPLNLSAPGITSNYGLLYTVLPQSENFDGKTLSVYVRFDPPPPASLGVTLQFIDHSDNWVPTSGNAPMYGLQPGWNLLRREFYGTQVQNVMALNFQVATSNGITSSNGVPYVGNMWIDEVNW